MMCSHQKRKNEFLISLLLELDLRLVSRCICEANKNNHLCCHTAILLLWWYEPGRAFTVHHPGEQSKMNRLGRAWEMTWEGYFVWRYQKMTVFKWFLSLGWSEAFWKVNYCIWAVIHSLLLACVWASSCIRFLVGWCTQTDASVCASLTIHWRSRS